MIETVKNSIGYVVAYLEYQVVNKDGVNDDGGEYVYVRDIWIHKAYRGLGCIQEMIDLCEKNPYCKNVKWVYWNREKYNNRLSHTWPRHIVVKKESKDEMVKLDI